MEPEYPRVLIEWIDSVSSSNGPWSSKEDIEQQGPAPIKTLGYLFKEGLDPKSKQTFVTVVSSLGEHDCSGDMTIPCKSILNMTIL